MHMTPLRFSIQTRTYCAIVSPHEGWTPRRVRRIHAPRGPRARGPPLRRSHPAVRGEGHGAADLHRLDLRRPGAAGRERLPPLDNERSGGTARRQVETGLHGDTKRVADGARPAPRTRADLARDCRRRALVTRPPRREPHLPYPARWR